MDPFKLLATDEHGWRREAVGEWAKGGGALRAGLLVRWAAVTRYRLPQGCRASSTSLRDARFASKRVDHISDMQVRPARPNGRASRHFAESCSPKMASVNVNS